MRTCTAEFLVSNSPDPRVPPYIERGIGETKLTQVSNPGERQLSGTDPLRFRDFGEPFNDLDVVLYVLGLIRNGASAVTSLIHGG